ncbi:hypothetical protein K435DRAFT_872533 [Dendrothele bispora CBS 962.96]|uniref:Uncharacterized protein n=1 Tax=Dendrothele bispora (strain CBS 962.96) TaxID=1314807 RepID=A0A4S8L1D5_DENBC|nr:hypothetical protein K435DRAFT_872533 [Dendrothele bispora CBS 962.96]
MAPRPDLACAVVDLSRRRMPAICTVSFARTYTHAGTIDDLLLDGWFPPEPHSYLRAGLSLRRLYITHRLEPDHTLLPNPFTIVVSAEPPEGVIDLTTGNAVIVKHAGPDFEGVQLENVLLSDLSVVSDIIRFLARNQVNNGYRHSTPSTDYQYLTIDRRHLVGVEQPALYIERIAITQSNDCQCIFCQLSVEVVLIAMEYIDIHTLTLFSATCRTHLQYARQVMFQRVRRVFSSFVESPVDSQKIHDILRDTKSIVSGPAGVTPLLPGLPSLPNRVEIFVPRNALRPWLQLFKQRPLLTSYIYCNSKLRMNGMRVERMRCVFILQNEVVVTIRESYTKSLLPLLLSQSITALVGGITHNSVFSLYPRAVSDRVGVPVFDSDTHPPWYIEGHNAQLSFNSLPVNLQPVTVGECKMAWRRSSGCHGIMSLPWGFYAEEDVTFVPELGDFLWRKSTSCDIEGCLHLDR